MGDELAKSFGGAMILMGIACVAVGVLICKAVEWAWSHVHFHIY